MTKKFNEYKNFKIVFKAIEQFFNENKFLYPIKKDFSFNMTDNKTYVKYEKSGFGIYLSDELCNDVATTKFLIEHEILHVIQGHTKYFKADRKNMIDIRSKNMAMDCIINSFSSRYLRDANFPEGIAVITDRTIYDRYKVDIVRTDSFLTAYSKIKYGMEEKKKEDEKKKQEQNKKDDQDEQGQDEKQKSNGEQSQDEQGQDENKKSNGEKSQDEQGQDENKKSNGEKSQDENGQQVGHSQHMNQDEPEQEPEQTQDEQGQQNSEQRANNLIENMKEKIAQSDAYANGSSRDASPLREAINNAVSEYCAEKLESKYQTFLNMIKARLKNGKRSTWSRPSRRLGVGFKGKLKKKDKSKIIIVIDSSGSMVSDIEDYLNKFLNSFDDEKKYKIDIVIGDTKECYFKKDFNKDDCIEIMKNPRRLGGGGTRMHFIKNRLKTETYDNIIFFTDLQFYGEDVQSWSSHEKERTIVVSPTKIHNNCRQMHKYFTKVFDFER